MKIVFSGAGYIANIHAQAALSQPDVELAAVVEKFSDKSKTFAGKFGVKCCYTSVEQLLDDVSVDALVICTPNFLHAPQAIAALERGVHVMVEKPMAMNAAEAETMIAASQKSGATLMVAHCWRFDKDVLWLKEQSDKLGKIIRTKGYGVHTHWGPSGWFTQKVLAGGGALADMGIHALDTARFLLGDPQPVSVYAKIGTYYTDFDVDDTGLIIVSWDNGATSYIESGWWQPHSDGPEAATQLYGTQGFGQLFPTRLELPNMKEEKLDVIDAGFEFPRTEHCPQSMYNAQMAYFIECIKTDRMPVPGGAEGLVNMKVVDASYESAKTGKVVELKR
ncbi:MAG: Gfo/Idh/MocA family oxidoreductase [Anaerolineales bacterium]|nr:Gfo/Idh/MocA family oxidoreductase [Anaerolineales bacterium]